MYLRSEFSREQGQGCSSLDDRQRAKSQGEQPCVSRNQQAAGVAGEDSQRRGHRAHGQLTRKKVGQAARAHS